MGPGVSLDEEVVSAAFKESVWPVLLHKSSLDPEVSDHPVTNRLEQLISVSDRLIVTPAQKNLAQSLKPQSAREVVKQYSSIS